MDADRRTELLQASVEVPERTVYRRFPTETVAINADTGHYFGLNASAVRMLEALGEAGTVAGALALLAELFDRPAKDIESHLLDLCTVLEERGLIVVVPHGG